MKRANFFVSKLFVIITFGFLLSGCGGSGSSAGDTIKTVNVSDGSIVSVEENKQLIINFIPPKSDIKNAYIGVTTGYDYEPDDNAYFEQVGFINSNTFQIKFKELPDYETKNQYKIEIITNYNDNSQTKAYITVNIIDVEEVEYIDASNITDEMLVTAKAISDVEINENTTIDEFYQSIRYIDNIKATKNDETVLVEFGEVKIIFDNQNIEYDDTSSNESRSLRNNNKNLRGFNEITCDNSEKNAIFLSPFDWENSYEYGGDKYNNDVRNKLEDKGYCVDTITNESKRINRISYELFKNLNKYDFVYIDTHSNELGHLTLNNILSSNLEDIILKLKNNEIKLKKGEVINARPNLWNKLTIGYDTGGYNYYEAIGVEFFNTLDFKTKNTLFFIHGCNTLKIQPSSPIAQSIIKNNGKGVIGFKTYSSASWTDRLLKEYISNFTLEDSKINKSIEDTISNLENSVNIDGLMAWIGDIKTLHFQANDESELQGESGDPRINLNWSGSADLDISVTDPCGNTIYYGDREKTCGGYTGKLDIDANADIFPDDPQENIAWTNGGMPGDYKIHLSNLDSSNVSYVITIINNGETTTKTGVINGNEEKDIITITH